MPQQATAAQIDLFSSKDDIAPPCLLVEWQPFWPPFLGNLRDALRRATPTTPLPFAPGKFWPDVFVHQPVSWKDFGRSIFLHSAALFFLLTTGRFWMFPPAVTVRAPFDNTTLTYYKVDELLPQVKSAPAPRPHARVPQKAQPELAKQDVISVPVVADNAEQTIVNPPHPDIVHQTQPLPNLIVSTPTPAPPAAALAQSRVTLPQFLIKPVQPAPDVIRTTQARLPKIAMPEAVQPTVAADDLKIKNEIKLLVDKIDPVVESPKLPPPQPSQSAAAPLPEAVPPPPSTQGLAAGSKAAGQLMVLNVRPVAPPAEIKIPNGSRAGIFAASPTGKAGAPGTPEIEGPAAETNATGNNGRGNSPDVNSGNAEAGIPPGISVSGIPLNSRAAAVVASPTALPPKAEPHANAPDAGHRTFAMASPDVSRRTFPPYVSSPERKPEDTVFAGKKYYSMQLNMPNLTSAAGSWIIRFAELKDNKQEGELSTPVVTDKVDPAYPADLMRDQVEGTVILYAVIRADGSVGDVRVLQSLHESLDANACRALGRWRFRPATKNGVPVDLEAVVRIPFKARKVGF